MAKNTNNNGAAYLQTLDLLYVEDDVETRDILARYLGRRFKSLDVAANGKEGLQAFQQKHHDIIITDIKMPLMDGLEMAEQIRAIADDVPIVVITAYSDLDYMLRSIELGVDNYVIKPVDPDKLLEAVSKSVRSKFNQRELAKARQLMACTLEDVVAMLARAIEMRDPYTDGHQRRVAQLAVAIAEEMGLNKHCVDGLRLSALIHDVGKIRIPAEVLSKPGKLTPIEFGLIKEHALSGYEIIQEVEFPWPLAQIVAQHHERIDGSGYPNGLKADHILPEAKVLAVADVVEAMSSHRPYRAALGIEVAIAEITNQRGKLYDPQAVDACLAVLARKPDFWEATAEKRP